MADTLDTIVIGGSAGGFGALRELLGMLPEGLPASLLVVLHSGRSEPPRAHDLLQQYTRLPLRLAEDGMAMRPGEVVFAQPDLHLLLGHEHVHLRRGPQENNFRPAIDPLFRSAAVYRGSRAAGVVLSGSLDDGAAGLHALAQAGGTPLVQDPRVAAYADMPEAAARAVPDAMLLSTSALAKRITAIAGQPVAPAPPPPDSVRLELMIAALERDDMATTAKLGELSPFNCPHCNGVLWEIEDGGTHRYRCHTGHAYGERSLSAAQEEALERSLYDALRAQKGRAELLRRMMRDAPSEASRKRLKTRADTYEEDAQLLETVLHKRRSEAEG